MLLVCGCSTAPPADVSGEWIGWSEAAMDTKVGLKVVMKQDKNKVAGTYHTTKVGPLGEQKDEGKVEGTVKGASLTLNFDNKELLDAMDMEPTVELELTEKDGERVLAGVVMPETGIGVKYQLKQPLKKK